MSEPQGTLCPVGILKYLEKSPLQRLSYSPSNQSLHCRSSMVLIPPQTGTYALGTFTVGIENSISLPITKRCFLSRMRVHDGDLRP